VEAIRGAARTGCVDVLVTDDRTATAILEDA
ncbi:MAG: putative sugar-binding domain, partial [Thermomicrobiales bacterium]|nr:putative sugar-binding domain [Thermomicrobiales bacterium]